MATNEAIDRLFNNVWICMRCNAKNRVGAGKKPSKCRKCNSKRLRLKNKVKKAKA
ncbi:MAG: 50S ribosomal protein L40e [Candidatus Diapherotrites archaeon CG08_land_8_20_14_0_20_34_12]|nr:MAG: 50S ribosomal protein L40e [Candidatus Diapherotrites archaeon CG08_land_8_20_14_0_20_34_12]